MIEMSKWEEMLKEWESIGPAYQIPRRSASRLRHFCTHALPFLQNKDVVEIGCNAGLFGYEISKVAKSYMGVEPANKVREKKKEAPRTDYFKQALLTKRHILEFNPNVDFVHDTIAEFCAKPFTGNAFVACFALYHFLNDELDLLKTHVWPKCDVVVIQNRVQDRPKNHNSYKFYKTKRVVKFFKEQGFEEVIVVSGQSEDKRQKFDECIFRRKANTEN
jgi:hypothetical protein